MTDGFSGKAQPSIGRGLGVSQAIGGPPPSTLAAQLVDTISPSTKSSRSDENSELKGLFATIQRVKDDPSILTSPAERLEHNHMLIYVYSRVVLESIKLDDPFLDRNHVRAEALKAINFMRFTIKETPAVVSYMNQDHSLLFRGTEPLWAWLLPQLLRMLGHAQCQELTGLIEGFMQYLLLVVARTGATWEVASPLSLYLRASLSGILDHLQQVHIEDSRRDVALDLTLPHNGALDQILGKSWAHSTKRTTYRVSQASQALRQASCLVKILAYPLISHDPAFHAIIPWSENGPWLLDAIMDINLMQKRWDSVHSYSHANTVELILEIIDGAIGEQEAAFFIRSKGFTILALTCSDWASTPGQLLLEESAGDDARLVFCKALAALAQASVQHVPIARLAESKLIGEVFLLSSQYSMLGDGTDTQRMATILRRSAQSSIEEEDNTGCDPATIENKELRIYVDRLRIPDQVPSSPVIESKRRKLDDHGERVWSALVQAIGELTGLEVPEDPSALEQRLLKFCENTDDTNRTLLFDLICRSSCMVDGCTPNEDMSPPFITKFICPMCDLENDQLKLSAHESKKRILALFQQLILSPSFLQSRRPRISAMLVLRRLARHSSDADLLNLEKSGPGQWCLQSLHSSIRELRIAAGRTLTSFILISFPMPAKVDMMRRNRQYALSLLKSISEKRQASTVETCIMAWGQLGKLVAEDELNLVLIQLLEYLGDNNNVVAAFAFNELTNIAEYRKTSVRRLFEPFWRSLAYIATKDMVHRPQMSRALAELLQMSVNELLVLIQSHALPWLVLDKKIDIIHKIAEARQETETWRPVTDGSNLAPILALLLVQETDDPGAFVKSRLAEISSHFQNSSLPILFQTEPVLIIIELLKAGADGSLSKKTAVYKALRFMATTILAGSKETKKKNNDIVGRFLEPYLLGIMTQIADIINDSAMNYFPVVEQRRSLQALQGLISVCRGHARVARPQMSACILSALAQAPLRVDALACWTQMIKCLEEEDVEALLQTTFFIATNYWSSLEPHGRGLVKEGLDLLLKEHQGLITKYISLLPSLSQIRPLANIEEQLADLRPTLTLEAALETFARRIGHDNAGVVRQALLDLNHYLHQDLGSLTSAVLSQRPDSAIPTLLRALLDCASKYHGTQVEVARLCTESLGLIGCVDFHQVETIREHRSIVVLNNFKNPEEITDFGLFLIEQVLVPSFLSATDPQIQGFLSYAMQELLDRCGIKEAVGMRETEILDGADIYSKWISVPDKVREVVTPFLKSCYRIGPMAPVADEHPVFRPGKPYGNWLRTFVISLLNKGQNVHASLLFEPLTRVIRVKDLSTAEFLLPYLVLHVLLGDESSATDKKNIINELLLVLQHDCTGQSSHLEKENMKKYCQAVFRVLDYGMRWIQQKRAHGGLSSNDKKRLTYVQESFDTMPAQLIAQRALDCNEYPRALFNLEQHTQKIEHQKREPDERTRLLEQLQDIYAKIDEPDGLEGIFANLPALDMNQQILGHRKAGRWAAAQTWYEMQLVEEPQNVHHQVDLLYCLREAGQHSVLLNHIDGMNIESSNNSTFASMIVPFAVEAAWMTSQWDRLEKFTAGFQGIMPQDFNTSVAVLLNLMHKNCDKVQFLTALNKIRDTVALRMTHSGTASLQDAHNPMIKCHVLGDLETLFLIEMKNEAERLGTLWLLDSRLDIIGADHSDKQYVLGIRRAAMELLKPKYLDLEISALWLSSARLARKANWKNQSFSAILHASQLGDDSAIIENAKLLWRDNSRREAIQMLQGAIEQNKFMTQTNPSASAANTSKMTPHQRLLTARAQLLLAKWLDGAGQSNASALREKYQQPPKTFSTWEKGHYYLGRHYKKILEAEKLQKVDDQSDNYLTGEIARLVIENYVRSLNSGTKYLYQTLPRVLTLWLDLGANLDRPPEGKSTMSRELHKRRGEQLGYLHSFLDKYIQRLPAYVFYTALSQMVARIAHQNHSVYERLRHIIVKVVEAHPRQAIWGIIGTITIRQPGDRKNRALDLIKTIRAVTRKVEDNYDLTTLLRAGEKIASQLLDACQTGDFHGNKTVRASLTRDLRFNHTKCTPCPLVVPVDSFLTATLPAVSDHVKKHSAFSRDVVTIDSFLDEVLVLSSLAKPRRLTARGSDGKTYMLLIKPKDDLRTDQRLMEFNGIINRSLKRDAESSRRQLYIRTYAVVPLNEECGIIEWVPGIKTMRDILLNLYAARKIHPDYMLLKQLMDEASTSESRIRIFTDDVLGRFPPVLQMWFIQQFPNPSTWFAARLRYTRSCAVMSMVGTILGLGDRHGENVNLEEGNGGVFHVDFNCLFDKGLTFAKPERVPFRLTHNMVAAMGIYGYEGPFRKSSELTLSICRQQEETLMTIFESFIYDPTLDLQKEKRNNKRDAVVKLQPQNVVDSIRRKVRGLLPSESIPLSVEGQVEELIKQAVDPRNLTAMYIGWCPFL